MSTYVLVVSSPSIALSLDKTEYYRWSISPQGGYRLTEKGEALRPVAALLARWGRDYLPVPGAAHDPRWTMFNLESAFRPERSGNGPSWKLTAASRAIPIASRRRWGRWTCTSSMKARIAGSLEPGTSRHLRRLLGVQQRVPDELRRRSGIP